MNAFIHSFITTQIDTSNKRLDTRTQARHSLERPGSQTQMLTEVGPPDTGNRNMHTRTRTHAHTYRYTHAHGTFWIRIPSIINNRLFKEHI